MKTAAFVPVKLNSRRLPNKNFLKLGSKPLAFYIFETLLAIDEIDDVFCYTSQSQILEILPKGVKLLPRPAALDSDEVQGNELFKFAVESLESYQHLVLCHPTGPFVSEKSIKSGINKVTKCGHDCAIAVEAAKSYAWFDGMPINYNPSDMVQTQNLIPILVETSGFYIFNRSVYEQTGGRVGSNPAFIELSRRESIDIDYPEDFSYAEHMISFDEQRQDYSFDRYFVDILDNKSVYGKISHFSFDMDGVIIDSIGIMQKSWHKTCEELNLDIPFSEYAKHIGRPLFDILTIIGVSNDKLQNAHDFYLQQSKIFQSGIKVYQPIVDLINNMGSRGLKISVVTSKPKERAAEIMNNIFGLNHDIILVTPDDLPSHRGKPSPDSILFACCLNGADPSQTIYIGDMEVDKIAANRASVHFVHASWGYEELPELDEVWFGDPESLCSYLIEISKV